MCITTGLLTAALLMNCASSRSPVDGNSPGFDCTHCHGGNLAGVRNTGERCGSCHDLKPLDAATVASPAIREIIDREPHVHRTKNMFRPTPSCFMCHRQTDWQEVNR